MTVTYKEQVLKLKVKVTDTLAPVIEKPKKALKAKVGEEVFIEKMALSVKEASDYTLTFEDGKNVTVFDTPGKVKKKVIATDVYNNTSEIELTFKVADENAPVFEGYGTKDRTVYLENGVDLMDGVFAKDAEDGDLTDKIKVSKVDTSTFRRKRSYIYSRGQYGKCKHLNDQTDDRECIRRTGSDHVCDYGSEHPKYLQCRGREIRRLILRTGSPCNRTG